ncbi:hypothetical protein [Burkholderia sp. Nafp2/4-1b]|uniref:hypothetical protein n=1 Tax=Burkholderia sp. Nafp2/4-1b TaxID=2116686 RepID=UPI0013CED48E|nr:hypothetical protein [Burkholderia sp. Nafp2/4-1b]
MLVEQRISVSRRRGLRVFAVDASDLRVSACDTTRRVIQHTKAFALYLPCVEMMLRATLSGTDTERPLGICKGAAKRGPPSGRLGNVGSAIWPGRGVGFSAFTWRITVRIYSIDESANPHETVGPKPGN